MKKAKLILMRHGESLYNLEGRFTGWSDVDLSEKGITEARDAGSLLQKHQIYPDICFTSWLKRSIHTANLALESLGWEHIDSVRSWQLNERHYGAWQGQKKDQVKAEVGEEHFVAIRRGYEMAPPPLAVSDPRSAHHEKKYAALDSAAIPATESLQTTQKRVVAYYQAVILKALQSNKDVLVAAHGNSLRALVMYLEAMHPQDVAMLEIPTGEIIVYTFDAQMQIIKKEVLLG